VSLYKQALYNLTRTRDDLKRKIMLNTKVGARSKVMARE